MLARGFMSGAMMDVTMRMSLVLLCCRVEAARKILPAWLHFLLAPRRRGRAAHVQRRLMR